MMKIITLWRKIRREIHRLCVLPDVQSTGQINRCCKAPVAQYSTYSSAIHPLDTQTAEKVQDHSILHKNIFFFMLLCSWSCLAHPCSWVSSISKKSKAHTTCSEPWARCIKLCRFTTESVFAQIKKHAFFFWETSISTTIISHKWMLKWP